MSMHAVQLGELTIVRAMRRYLDSSGTAFYSPLEDAWALPGGRIVTTKALQQMAAREGAQIAEYRPPGIPPLSTALPRAAAELLQRAAGTAIPDVDPLCRQKAIEHAEMRVKREYPLFFRSDEE